MIESLFRTNPDFEISKVDFLPCKFTLEPPSFYLLFKILHEFTINLMVIECLFDFLRKQFQEKSPLLICCELVIGLKIEFATYAPKLFPNKAIMEFSSRLIDPQDQLLKGQIDTRLAGNDLRNVQNATR